MDDLLDEDQDWVALLQAVGTFAGGSPGRARSTSREIQNSPDLRQWQGYIVGQKEYGQWVDPQWVE